MVVSTVEHHHFVLLSSTKKLFAGAFARAFHKNLKLLADVLFVALSREFVLQGNHFVQAAQLRFFWHVVGQML